MDADGYILPTHDAEAVTYDPFESFVARVSRSSVQQPAFRDFANLADASDTDVLEWVTRSGRLESDDGQHASYLRAKALEFSNLALSASEAPSSGSLDAFTEALGSEAAYGVRLIPKVVKGPDGLTWGTTFVTNTLLDAYVAMLLLTLEAGRRVKRCPCGQLFVTSAQRAQTYCPPEEGYKESRCSMRFKKQRQRKRDAD